MNILFIDTSDGNITSKFNKYMYKHFGFYITKMNNNIFALVISNKVNTAILKVTLKIMFRNNFTYIVTSKYLQDDDYVLSLLTTTIKCNMIVTEQNNLTCNDVIYINEYIEKNNLKIENIKVLVIIDNLDKCVKEKIDFYIKKYKVLDVLVSNPKILGEVKEYTENINYSEGTAIETIDKLHKVDYNILLMFSQTYKLEYNNSSFILDYNDSDLDVKSNTYLMYKKYEKNLYNIFSVLGLKTSRFKKTKLGKLCILVGGIMLDK